MPIDGGLPQRRTWDGDVGARRLGSRRPPAHGRTARYSTLPSRTTRSHRRSWRTSEIDSACRRRLKAAYSADGHTLFFTRWFRQWSETKRYKGGRAENIWRFDGKNEAVPLTADWTGTSTNPMFWNGRVYFLSTATAS